MWVGTKVRTLCRKEKPPKDAGITERVYDGKGKLLMTGFFNAHTHSPMTLMRGYGRT